MIDTYQVSRETFDKACASVSKAASLLIALDDGQLLDHIDCPPNQARKVMAALETMLVAKTFVEEAREHLSAAADGIENAGLRGEAQ